MNLAKRVSIGLGLVGLGLLGSIATLHLDSPDATAATEKVSVISGSSDPEKIVLEQQAVQDQAKNEEAQKDPGTRQKAAAQKAAGYQPPADAADGDPALTAADCPAQIVGDAPAPVPSGEFLPVNSWSGVVGKYCVSVYAGQNGTDDATDGAVYVFRIPLGDGDAVGAQTVVPKSGPLSVVSFKGTRITLRDASSVDHIFDAVTGVLVK